MVSQKLIIGIIVFLGFIMMIYLLQLNIATAFIISLSILGAFTYIKIRMSRNLDYASDWRLYDNVHINRVEASRRLEQTRKDSINKNEFKPSKYSKYQ